MGNWNFGEKTKQNIATEGMTHTVGFFCIAPSPIHPSIYYFSFLPPLMMSDIRFQATSNGDGDFADFSPSLAVLLSFFFPPCGPIGKSSLIDGTDAALLALRGYTAAIGMNERTQSGGGGSKSQLGQSQTMLMSYTDGLIFYATAPPRRE